MRLKSLKSKKKVSMAASIDKQMETDISIDAGVCPVCNGKLTTYWNEQQTHKWQVCIVDEIHHKQLVDYEKDND